MLSSNENLRLPPFLRKGMLSYEQRRDVHKIMRAGGLFTVCEEARCPNIGDCFSRNQATFMIMGDRCTRRCHFCSVTTKKPRLLDLDEPRKVAEAALKLGLTYVVVTSVDRDELPDFGARHFARVVEALKSAIPIAKIEVLVPDFRGKRDLIDIVLDTPINVFGHNIESVARLYKSVRPQSDFLVTQRVLSHASQAKKTLVKSGMMVGLGETDEEVFETLTLLKNIGVDIVTIGQYLRPSLHHWPVHRYVQEEQYKEYVAYGKSLGLKHVFAGPFVRSSYHAEETHIKTVS